MGPPQHLVCLAALKPAEFVLIQIQQIQTALV
jgi:hypothetical protein